jgi:protein-tyrosine phosphatase
MNRVFVDYHSHLLPAIDDGAGSVADSLAMARILSDFGFAAVHCTPHLIKGGFDNPPDRVRQATRSLQRTVDEAGIALRLVPGTEHYLDEFLPELAHGALTVDASRYLLVEAPFNSGAEMLPQLVAELHKQKLLPLFAHPERCSVFQPPLREEGMFGALSFILGKRREADLQGSLIEELKAAGCRFQGNIGSFAGVYGSVVKQRALLLLQQGVYSCLGSDAHTAQGLADILASGFETVAAAVGEPAALKLLQGFDSKTATGEG